MLIHRRMYHQENISTSYIFWQWNIFYILVWMRMLVKEDLSIFLLFIPVRWTDLRISLILFEKHGQSTLSSSFIYKKLPQHRLTFVIVERSVTCYPFDLNVQFSHRICLLCHECVPFQYPFCALTMEVNQKSLTSHFSNKRVCFFLYLQIIYC